MTIDKLFFELIQVSLGTRICLSQTSSANERSELLRSTINLLYAHKT